VLTCVRTRARVCPRVSMRANVSPRVSKRCMCARVCSLVLMCARVCPCVIVWTHARVQMEGAILVVSAQMTLDGRSW
jgi:hypothetical protein